MITEKQIECDKCDGEGKIKIEGIDTSISSTAWVYEIVTCSKCNGKGKLKEFTEMKKWLETLDREKVE